MKFLHTADWQIGMKALGFGDIGRKVREQRLISARKVIDAAKLNQVEFILIAGDTFEDNAVDRVLVQRVADILKSSDRPVYIIPGNHDPLVPGSVWEHPAWRSSDNIQIIEENIPITVSGGLLYPSPTKDKQSQIDPTAWIRDEFAGTIRVGLAHGSVEGLTQDELFCPIPVDASSKAKLDYLALGHFHSYSSYKAEDGEIRMAYSGTHETTRFGERDSGKALIVEIPGAGACPKITPINTGGLCWMQFNEPISQPGDLARLLSNVEKISSPEVTLVSICITGILPACDQSIIDHLEQICSSRFLWGNVDSTNLKVYPDDDGWVNFLPQGIIIEAAKKLCNSQNEPPEQVKRALMELYAISQEVQR